MPVIDPSNQIKALEEHDPAPPELIAEAKQVVADQLRGLSLSQSVLSSIIIGMLRRVYTTALPTYAVTLAGDGFPMLLINPTYAVKLGPEGGVGVLAHEAGHLLNMHLYCDPALNADEMWNMACEGTINHWWTELLKRPLPVIDGEEQGVNPRKLWERYRDDLKKQGKEPCAFADFIRTDLGCYAELSRMSKPPNMSRGKGQINCVHVNPDADGANSPGDPNGSPVQLDQSAVDSLVDQALDIAVHEAKANDNKLAKDELLKLEQRTKGSARAEKVWGDKGLGSLRGETVETRKVDYWQQWLASAMAERLEEGERLRYLRKQWWEPRVAHRGDETYKYGMITFDTSGSMRQEVVEFLTRQVGETEGLKVDWGSHDGSYMPFKPGEAVLGGGGTNFQCISDHYDELDDKPDFCLVVTDGWAPPITPTEPDKWIWLIVPGGDPWPENHTPPMETYLMTDMPSE